MTESLTLQVDTYPGGFEQPPHAHRALHLSLVLAGQLRETIGGRTEFAGALSVVGKDPGVVHADRFGPEPVTIARLTLRDAGLARLIDPDRDIAPWHWAHEARVTRPFLQLVSAQLEAPCHIALDNGALLDLLAALTAREAPVVRGAPPVWLREAMERLRAEWTPSLTVREVARHADVHPVYFARCVRRWYGHGVCDELQRLRLSAAATRLAAGNITVSAVAHATGYSDEAHLCRAFRTHVGATPGGFRDYVRGLNLAATRPRN